MCVGPPWDHRGIYMYYQVVDSSNDNENDELTYEAAKLTRSLNMLDIYIHRFKQKVLYHVGYSVYSHLSDKKEDEQIINHDT